MTPPVEPRRPAPGTTVKPAAVPEPNKAVAAPQTAGLGKDKVTVNSGPTEAEIQQMLVNINAFLSNSRMTGGKLGLNDTQQKELCRRLAEHEKITLRDFNEVVFKTTYIGPFPLGQAMTESAWESFTGGNKITSLKALEHYCNEFEATAPQENLDFLTFAYCPRIIRISSRSSTLLARIHQQEFNRELTIDKQVIDHVYGKDDETWKGYLEEAGNGKLKLKPRVTWFKVKQEIGKLGKEKEAVLLPQLQQLCPYSQMVVAHYNEAKRIYDEVSQSPLRKNEIKEENPTTDDYTDLLEHINDLKEDGLREKFDRLLAASLFNGLYVQEQSGDTSIFRFMNKDFDGLDDPIMAQLFAEKVILPYATENKPVDPATIKKLKHDAELVGKLRNRLHWSDKELAEKFKTATIDPTKFEAVLKLVKEEADDEKVFAALKAAIPDLPPKHDRIEKVAVPENIASGKTDIAQAVEPRFHSLPLGQFLSLSGGRPHVIQ